MMKAYSDGIPANGKPVPDGAMMAQIEWTPKSDAASPYTVNVPDTLKSLSFMVKDSKRYARTSSSPITPNDSGGFGSPSI